MRRSGRLILGMPLLWIATLIPCQGAGDQPGSSRLGRLFRFGSSSASNSNSSSSPASPPQATSPTDSVPTAPSSSPLPLPETSTPLVSPGPTVTPRIIAQPRVTQSITESDPIVTRITLNRSDDGRQFGMFLQVYADGTVIDSEGVHQVGQDALKPIVEVLQSGELSRPKSHCGAPATDYIESVQVIVYERSLGRLRANSFSYSGNPQGCDNAIRHLHAALEGLQAKLIQPVTMPAGTVSGLLPPPVPTVNPLPSGGQTVIPLTTPN
jgi:hypothetical protein